MMTLADCARGKDNNFNLIRMLAAMAVLVTHSYPLSLGPGTAEPLSATLGMTLGGLAVDVFFITSGFLVTASLMNRQSAIEFVWARVLRIFPALMTMLTVTVFGIGAYFTSLPLASYLTHPKIYAYWLKCATLIRGITYKLPGVFESNPYPYAVNGSLWTLPSELKMYGLLLAVWLFLRLARQHRMAAFKFTLVACGIGAGVLVIARRFFIPAEGLFVHLFYMFFSGAAFYVLRQHIVLSIRVFCVFVSALVVSALLDTQAFFVVYLATLAYVLFYLAYVPGGKVRAYNRLGDYSYGIYIYAFPVQQSVAALMPDISIASMMLISGAITIALAFLSWHLVEQRALALKTHFVGGTHRVLGRGNR